MGCLWSTIRYFYPLSFSFLDNKDVEMITAPAGKEELLRYTVNPGGVSDYIHHRYLIPCIRPKHDKPVIIPPEKIDILHSIGCTTKR
jgi:hypothetical protein